MEPRWRAFFKELCMKTALVTATTPKYNTVYLLQYMVGTMFIASNDDIFIIVKDRDTEDKRFLNLTKGVLCKSTTDNLNSVRIINANEKVELSF